MWLNTRLPPCHRPSSVWYCGESATRQAGSQVACTAFVPTIQPTTASSTTHVASTVAVQAGPASAAGASAPAANAAARSAIRPIRRIRDLRSLSFGELLADMRGSCGRRILGHLVPQVLGQVARTGNMVPLLCEHGNARLPHERGRLDGSGRSAFAKNVDHEGDQLAAAVDPPPEVVLLAAGAVEERAEVVHAHARELGDGGVGGRDERRFARADAVDADLAVALSDLVLDRDRIRDRVPDRESDVPAEEVEAQRPFTLAAPPGKRREELPERLLSEAVHDAAGDGRRPLLERLQVRQVVRHECIELVVEVPRRVELRRRDEGRERLAPKDGGRLRTELAFAHQRAPDTREQGGAAGEDGLDRVDPRAIDSLLV